MPDDIFVDRKNELERLESFFEEAKKGTPTFAFISGEAGAGKAHLVEHFLEEKKDELASFSYTATLEDRTIPYHPFTKFLDQFSKMDEADLGTEATARLSKLNGILGSKSALVGDVTKEREVLFEAFAQFFESVSRSRVLVLFIDNLHCCDEGSILLMQHLALEVEGSNLLVIANYRPEALDETEDTVHPITGLMATLMMQDRLNTFLLERFGALDTRKMLAALLGVTDVPDEFVSFIQERTEGSPFYISELVGSMLEQGIIDTSNPHWFDELELDRIQTPGGVNEAISRRLDHIDDNTCGALEMASVLGNRFSIPDLAFITGRSEEELSKAMSDVIERKILFEVLDSDVETYGFDHSRIRDVLYESLDKASRKKLHGKIGEMLETRSRPLDYAYSLAHHFTEAGDVKRGHRYARVSGDLALGTHAPTEAYNYYLKALELIDSSGLKDEMARERIELLNLIGEIGYHIGDWNRAIAVLEDALDSARELKDERLLVNSLVALGDILRFKSDDIPRAIEMYSEVLDISERAGFEDKIIEGHRGLGYVRWREGEYDKAEKHYKVMIESAEKTGNRRMFGTAHIEMGNLFSSKGNFPEAIDYYNKAVEILEEENYFFELARAYNNIGDAYLQTKKWDLAIENFGKCGEISEDIGLKDMQGWSLFNTAEALAKKGELDTALDKCEKANIILRKLDDGVGLQGIQKNMAIIYRFKKEWDKSEEHFGIAEKMAEELNYPHAQTECLIEWGQMYLDKGDKVRAKEILEKAVEIAVRIEAKEFAARAKKIMEDGGIA